MSIDVRAKQAARTQGESHGSRDQCRYCWCLSTCSVGCFASLEDDGSVTEEAKLKACALCRCRMHRLLIDYCEVLEENPKGFDYASGISLR